jgi:fatty-acid peroxygenase
MDQIVLHEEVQEILCRTVCKWAGIPLTEPEAKLRTREFGAMIDGAGAVGPRNWSGLRHRARTERWGRDIIVKVRTRKLDVPQGSAAQVIAWQGKVDGESYWIPRRSRWS